MKTSFTALFRQPPAARTLANGITDSGLIKDHEEREDNSWIAMILIAAAFILGVAVGDHLNDAAHRAAAEREVVLRTGTMGWR